MRATKITKQQMRDLEKQVGDRLFKKHGKKKSYTPSQIQEACRKSNTPIDWHCWAMCFYTDHESFDFYHESIGESCDYVGMKTEMVSALTEGASDSWVDFDFDLSWLELPDFDFSSFFDFFD